MSPEDRFVPFGTAWISDLLYRVVADHGDRGKLVEVDGWQEAMDEAWRGIVDDLPEYSTWVKDYRAASADCSLGVTITDVTRVSGRRGYGGFGVSYPADLLLEGDDKVASMRTLILTAIDRHVDRCELGVPLLSEAVSGA
ncbi:hypothetical protein KDN32_21545 [Nocardioides sp. J2M5]|uniref:hypothetical protein n=1 Tax=Nocardioides palaemonis TaxID=2829810 RepID=UPI001BA6E973|nr:hypothetical protein [Nocardioides palaemonis]MBS2940329.1 hypothetical protein [Nocardioides palaemonis]